MTFKKLVAATLLIAGSLTVIQAGRRSIAKDTRQATCAHTTTKPAEIASTIYPGLILKGRVCESCRL